MTSINIGQLLKEKYNLDIKSMDKKDLKKFIEELRKKGDKSFITIRK